MSISRTRRPKRRRPGAKARSYPNLARFIKQTGTTQAEIAAAVGSTQAYISRLAAGRVVPRASLAIKIARHCRIPIESFTLAYAKRLEAAPKQSAA